MRYAEFEITETARPLQGGGKTFDAAAELARLERALEDARMRAGDAKGMERRKFFLALIEGVIDNLDRSLGNEPPRDDASGQRWFKRTQRMRRQLDDLLRQHHVEPIDLVSAPPGLVEVAEVEVRDDVPDGTVVSVNWRGWLIDGELLRKPNVIVAQNDGGGKQNG